MPADVIQRWHAVAHHRPSGFASITEVGDLVGIGTAMARELGALRERNMLLETTARQYVVAFIERLAAQPCAWLKTQHDDCDESVMCIYCEARIVYERMRAEI